MFRFSLFFFHWRSIGSKHYLLFIFLFHTTIPPPALNTHNADVPSAQTQSLARRLPPPIPPRVLLAPRIVMVLMTLSPPPRKPHAARPNPPFSTHPPGPLLFLPAAGW